MVSAHHTDRVRIIEVGPRDGLQNIKAVVPATTKIELINRLAKTGLQAIELTSIVSPKAIPQLADCREVLSNARVKSLVSGGRLRAPVLVPNLKGLELAHAHGVREVAVFVSAGEGFSRANINCSVEEGLKRANEVTRRALELGLEVRGYVSSIFACPFDGETDPKAVLHCARRLLNGGCYEVSLGDTLGIGSPAQTKKLFRYLLHAGLAASKLAGHFHDTFGQAVANAWAAYECGIRTFDSSVSGLGGCPYAPGAEGNVATEDLVYSFEQAGISTGVDFDALVEVGHWISQQLKRSNASRAGNARAAKLRAKASPTGTKTSTPSIDWQLWSSCKPDDEILIAQNGPNVKITLNRPRNGNALTHGMMDRLTAFLDDASARFPEISRIVFIANGKFFCTGMDLSKGGTSVAKDQSATDVQFEKLTRLFEAVGSCKQTTIACIQGPALGGGVGLAFACDIRLAVRNANMRLSEVRLGLSPATISKYVVREWGIPFTREAMLSARIIPIAELYRIGAVAVVAEDQAQLDRHLNKYIDQLKACAPIAGSLCKELVHSGWAEAGQHAQMETMHRVFQDMMQPSAEGSVGVAAFQKGQKQIDWDAQRTKAKL